MSKRRIDFAHPLVRDAMAGRAHDHSTMRQVTEKVLGLSNGSGIARPGKTAFERWKREKKH